MNFDYHTLLLGVGIFTIYESVKIGIRRRRKKRYQKVSGIVGVNPQIEEENNTPDFVRIKDMCLRRGHTLSDSISIADRVVNVGGSIEEVEEVLLSQKG